MKKILVVEDDPVNAHVLREFLRAYGYEALVAPDGAKGVSMFAAERPDLVIIDVLLPFKNGYDVFEDLRAMETGRKTPMFMMSAAFQRIADVHEKLPLSERAQAYFTKPFDLHTLLDHVQFYAGS